jgi:V/A-type H+-transporting ATPase subunit I
MTRVDVLTLPDDVERIAGLLVRDGSLHVIETKPPVGESTAERTAEESSPRERIDRCIDLAETLLQGLDLGPVELDPARLEAFLQESTETALQEAEVALHELQDAIDACFQDQHDAEAAIARLDALSEQMHLLDEHGFSFLELQRFRHLCARCGTMGRAQTTRLTERLREDPCAFVTRPFHGNEAAFLLIGDGEQAARFDGILKDSGARPSSPPDRYVGSFEEGLEQVEVDLWQQRDALAALHRRFTGLREEGRQTLSVWRARLRVHGVRSDAVARFGAEGAVTWICGFVPNSRQSSLLGCLEREASGRYFVRMRPGTAGGEVPVPTRLRNAGMFRPFELFVKTYGLPAYNDVDPTPFVAVSFLAMFGMMFGDVGHGLVLAILGSGLAWLPYRIFLPVRDLGRVLMMAGLSGTLFGFLFGSVFGIESDAVLPALWMRPSHPENLTLFLGAALGLGVAVLSTGILLSIVQALRQGRVRQALIGQWSASSLAFFWGMLAVFGLRLIGKDVAVPPALLAVILALPLCLIAGGQIAFTLLDRRRSAAGDGDAHQEPEEEWATLLFEPVEIVMNLFTNSVSFLRVAAFGLAHAALTMAVFVVNDMVRVPGAAVLSLPLEHVFIILLEGMIVTIQCLRLEYYEFFSKFFSGNGVAYAPLVMPREDRTE